jgi:hypothetical protein
MDKPADPIFKIPDFFVGKTVLDDAVKGDGFISLKDLPKENKEIIEELDDGWTFIKKGFKNTEIINKKKKSHRRQMRSCNRSLL